MLLHISFSLFKLHFCFLDVSYLQKQNQSRHVFQKAWFYHSLSISYSLLWNISSYLPFIHPSQSLILAYENASRSSCKCLFWKRTAWVSKFLHKIIFKNCKSSFLNFLLHVDFFLVRLDSPEMAWAVAFRVEVLSGSFRTTPWACRGGTQVWGPGFGFGASLGDSAFLFESYY